MRSTHSEHGLTVLAVAGNHVVLLGWDLAEATIAARRRPRLRDPATRHEDGDKRWLKGMKTFAATVPHPAPGVPVSSYRHPFQTFQWADYSGRAGPDVHLPRRPGERECRPRSSTAATVEVTVTTERVDLGTHAVFFNRGAVGSQEYARRFQNLTPPEVGQAAYDWLSRGLVEGLESFIGQAGAGDALLGAFFEFKNTRIYAALQAARARGATVAILYDGDSQRAAQRGGDGRPAASTAWSSRATRSGGFAHNKFLVLSRGGVAERGLDRLDQPERERHLRALEQRPLGARRRGRRASTRATGRSSTTTDQEADRARRRGAVAARRARRRTGRSTPSSRRAARSTRSTATRSSPAHAERALFMTFAFGMNERFVPSFDRTDDVLRFALMEKKGNGSDLHAAGGRHRPDPQAPERHRRGRPPRSRSTASTAGSPSSTGSSTRRTSCTFTPSTCWSTRSAPTAVVVVGSANFSAASTLDNDENMLVIRGNTAVADIYLGEFMRLFCHYAFRESLTFKGATTPAQALLRKYLIASPSWIEGARPGEGYFDAGSDRALRRLYFSGQ